jgi:molybdopterin-binding protein
MKMGARNNLKGNVTQITKGDVMCHVKVTLTGGDHTMSSVMTIDSMNDLGLQEGDDVVVIAKAVNVMIGKE